MPTFGFELEWQSGGNAITRELFNRSENSTGQLIGTDHQHRYHCSCDVCTVYEPNNTWGHRGFLLRAQTDSSCDGELISEVFDTDDDGMEEAISVFREIQSAAIEVDAEPGLNAGMHVHVGGPQFITRASYDGTYSPSIEPLMAFAKWEHILLKVAAGRWQHVRPFNNSVRENINYSIRSSLSGIQLDALTNWQYSNEQFGQLEGGALAWLLHHSEIDGRTKRSVLKRAVERHFNSDRHSNLCTSTGHSTWEFRLWNATRSAWRMELFTRLSLALVDADFYQPLYAATDVSMDGLLAFTASYDPLLHNLLDRQVSYMNTVTPEIHNMPLTAV